MPQSLGYAIATYADGRVKEQDTFTCAHCNRVVFVPTRAAADQCGGFCRLCMKMVCPTCNGVGLCIPFEKKLDFVESKGILGRGLDDKAREIIRREFPTGGG